MSAEPLRRVLEATGYLDDGEAAPGVRLGLDAQSARRGRRFAPDALWRGPTATTVYFKYVDAAPDVAMVSTWQREIWNEGFAPLLWVISPKAIELYNGFGRPTSETDAARHRLRTFQAFEHQLVELDHLAGRLAMETGQFWLQSDAVNRKTSVDEQLLADLAMLERDLVRGGMERGAAQGLIGRSIFTQYLVDREIVSGLRLAQECGMDRLPAALRRPDAAERLFGWLADVFNGDMFPPTTPTGAVAAPHLARVADFLEATNPVTGQRTFFPYQFDIIPVELISSIYEQFAHSKVGTPGSNPDDQAAAKSGAETPTEARARGVHYTRLPVVSLILDEVMSNATGDETVLDLTCGSGVFLVEALRRLVERKGGAAPARALIRSTLYEQICGVDISEAAIRVAAFSLYLAALELDPDPQPPEALKFRRLIGESLFIGDARDIETRLDGAKLLAETGERRTFDIVVGNPPWTFRGKAGTDERRSRQQSGQPRAPRGEGFDFVLRATDFGHGKTRYGIVLSAMPFFAGSKTGTAAARYVVEQLAPVTLVNLAPLTKWLFPTAKMPAVVLLARHRAQDPALMTVVNVPWSPSTEKSYTFEIAPSDVTVLPLREWSVEPERLKTAVFGHSRDMALLDQLRIEFGTLDDWLKSVGSRWRDGLQFGSRAQDATHLAGLQLLNTKDLLPFQVPKSLKTFSDPKAHRPRSREIYKAPILLIKEFFNASPRPVTAVAESDLVYTEAYFGASLPRAETDSARLIAAILGSSLASWFFLLTASEFGIWKRRLLTSDVGRLPVPHARAALATDAAQAILTLEAAFRADGPTAHGLSQLDAAVFALYKIDEADQIIVNDGLVRAGWQWSEGRNASGAPASIRDDLAAYATSFAAGFDPWLEAANARHLRAEIFELPHAAPLRVVRFVLAPGRQASTIEFVPADQGLGEVLDAIGRRLQVRLGSALVGERELRVHGQDEVVIIKPAARRFWMPGLGLEDADAVVSESFVGVAAA